VVVCAPAMNSKLDVVVGTPAFRQHSRILLGRPALRAAWLINHLARMALAHPLAAWHVTQQQAKMLSALEVKLQCGLDFAIVQSCGSNNSKSTRTVREGIIRLREVRMVEGVEKLGAEFQIL
jgi:hypothetical protein